MNINFGLFPPIEVPKEPGVKLRGTDKTVAKRKALTARARADTAAWLNGPASVAADAAE
jgi:methylenetetrahydrofolate--tRNA-(uracil-5-)-methyltransferase